MRKHLLSFVLGAVGISVSMEANAQAISYVGPRVLITTQTPSAIEGMKNFTYSSDPSGTVWGGALTSVWNHVPLVLADATDSILCTATPGSLTGKWALIWRGNCEFGSKAKKAQLAGATGVMIINNVPGAGPVGMGAGADGASVTIPVIMVSNPDGQAIDAMEHTANTVYISVTPYGFNNAHDLCIPNDLFALSPGFAIPASQLDASNGNPKAYKSFLSAWVANTGTSDESNVKLNLDVNWVPTVGSPSLFHKDSITVPGTFAALDSLDLLNSPTGAFDMHASGTGRFDFTYTANMTNTDAQPIDNMQTFSMYATTGTFCNSKYNIVNGEPIVSSGLRVGGTNPPPTFTWGPLFYVAHAADAYNLQMALYADTSHHDLSFIQNAAGIYYTAMFEWTDANSNSIMEPTELTLVGTGNHTFTTLDSQGHVFVAPFDTVIHMQSGKYYWPVAVMSNLDLYLGIDGSSNYYNRLYASDHLSTGAFKAFWAPLYEGGINVNQIPQTDTIENIPFTAVKALQYMPSDSMSLALGANTPSVALNTYFIPEKVQRVAIRPTEFTVFPNPATSTVNVKVEFPQAVPNVTFDIMSTLGQVITRVNKGTIKNGIITLNTSNLAAGNYYIIMNADGKTSFRPVTITK